MMGLEEPTQHKLFYTNFNLESRIRQNHPLRMIAKKIDFNFVYESVAACYGQNGNVSVPPPVILKLMLLLVFYNVRSERELISTLPERLDWLWFLGYDIDSSIPDHSVLSKARARWGVEIFKSFFERIVWKCVETGLVDGKKIFLDSSLIDANASNNSIVDRRSLKSQLNTRYKELESRLNEIQEKEIKRPLRIINNRYISTTDPEATLYGKGKSKLCYKTHRAVDERSEIITAVEITAGDIDDSHKLESMWLEHTKNTDIVANTVVADSKYGTIGNFIFCAENKINAHMPDIKGKQNKKGNKTKRNKIFPDTAFKYDASTDTYICPANKILKRKSLDLNRNSDYSAKKSDCHSCELKSQCTQNKVGRTIKRHLHQDVVNQMREKSSSYKAKTDIRKRQHLMERSFANAKPYGFDKARWRGLARVSIQELLVCCVQNIKTLIKQNLLFKEPAAIAMEQVKHELTIGKTRFISKSKGFHETAYSFFTKPRSIGNFLYFFLNSSPIFT
jgi:transposase